MMWALMIDWTGPITSLVSRRKSRAYSFLSGGKSMSGNGVGEGQSSYQKKRSQVSRAAVLARVVHPALLLSLLQTDCRCGDGAPLLLAPTSKEGSSRSTPHSIPQKGPRGVPLSPHLPTPFPWPPNKRCPLIAINLLVPSSSTVPPSPPHHQETSHVGQPRFHPIWDSNPSPHTT